MLELRPYQEQIVADVSAAFRQHKTICVQSPTGSGKTAIAGMMAYRASKQLRKDNFKQILYLCHKRELVRQATETLRVFGLEDIVGHIAAGYPVTPWHPLQVASIPTLVRRLDGKVDWLNPKIIFVDEAHHVRAETWERILQKYPGTYVVGMTATPARLDGKALGKIFSHMVCGPSIRELIDGNYLCDLDIYSLPGGADLRDLHKRMGEFNSSELDNRMTGKVVANTVDNWFRIARDRRTIHYAVTRRHSRDFVAQMVERGVDAAHVDGDTPGGDRDAVFRRFAEGSLQCVSNVGIITEGFDAPECDCVIVRKTASVVNFLQMVGRVMRPKADGRKGLLLDVGNNVDWKNHGDPRQNYKWSLEGGVELETGGEPVIRRTTRTCGNCGFVYAYGVEACPMCGHVPASSIVHEVDVELVRVDEAEMEKRKQKRKAKATKRQLNTEIMATGGDMAKLQAIAAKYGYSANWAYVIKQKFRFYWRPKRA